METQLYIAFAAVLGLMIGSFLNVVIYRVPAGKSIVRPRSACPVCGSAISGWDNIPVVSWLVLGGKCRSCKARISPRYPAVEALTGILWALAVWRFGVTIEGLSAVIFLSVLVAVTFIDLDHKLIPNKIVLPMMPVAAIFSLLKGQGPAVSGAAGFLIGGGLLLLIAMIYPGGMGGGDVKLTALMGLFLGWHVLTAVFLAFVAGGLAGGVYWLVNRLRKNGSDREVLKAEMPFGPFLAAGGAIVLFEGNAIWEWYRSVSGIA